MESTNSFIESNSNFERKYCHPFGRGAGLSAEFIGLLKKVDHCQRKGIQFCLQEIESPLGFSVEKGWCDYFLPLFSEIDLGYLSSLNRPHFPLDRAPIFKTIARTLLKNFSGADYFVFDDLSRLPDLKMARQQNEKEYWHYLQQLAKILWCFNSPTRREIDALKAKCFPKQEYVALHIRRGDKKSESPYVPLEKYLNAITMLKDHIPEVIYIASDDADIFHVLQCSLEPQFKCVRNVDYFSSGYDQANFNNSSADFRKKMTLAFLFDLEVVYGSTLFIGSSSSNIYYMARYFRANRNLIDLENFDFEHIPADIKS